MSDTYKKLEDYMITISPPEGFSGFILLLRESCKFMCAEIDALKEQSSNKSLDEK